MDKYFKGFVYKTTPDAIDRLINFVLYSVKEVSLTNGFVQICFIDNNLFVGLIKNEPIKCGSSNLSGIYAIYKSQFSFFLSE